MRGSYKKTIQRPSIIFLKKILFVINGLRKAQTKSTRFFPPLNLVFKKMMLHILLATRVGGTPHALKPGNHTPYILAAVQQGPRKKKHSLMKTSRQLVMTIFPWVLLKYLTTLAFLHGQATPTAENTSHCGFAIPRQTSTLQM